MPPLAVATQLLPCAQGQTLDLSLAEKEAAPAWTSCAACGTNQYGLWEDVRPTITADVYDIPQYLRAMRDAAREARDGLAACLTCPAGGVCPGGAAVVPEEGRWHSAPNSTQVRRSRLAFLALRACISFESRVHMCIATRNALKQTKIHLRHVCDLACRFTTVQTGLHAAGPAAAVARAAPATSGAAAQCCLAQAVAAAVAVATALQSGCLCPGWAPAPCTSSGASRPGTSPGLRVRPSAVPTTSHPPTP